MKSRFVTRLLGGVALTSATMTGISAYAQDNSADTTDEVIVTGTRLNTNPNLTAGNPVLSVTDEEIDSRGTVRIEDFINILPQVFAGQAGEVSNGATGTSTLNLRGLGASRTLTLIDGRRLPYGSSNIVPVNLDLVPTQLIERVDILTGGASAVYGSDALGGVANFILKRDFEGFELDIQGGFAHNGNGVEPFDSVLAAASQPVPGGSVDGEEIFVSGTWGANIDDGRGNVTLYASYENKSAITQANRSISGCALGQDDGDQSFAGLGCIGSFNFRTFTGSGGFGFQEENGNIIPFVGGPAQTFNFGPFNFFQRPSERFQIYGRAHYELTENLEIFGDLGYTSNSSDAQIAPSASFGFEAFSINCDNPLIQGTPGLNLATDIFGCTPEQIANGEDVDSITATHRNVEGGPRNSRLENDALRIVGGLRGTLWDQWDFQAFAQYSETDDLSVSTNDFIFDNVQQAFFVVLDENNNPVCRDQSGGCVPYNIFQRDPSGTSLVTPEALDFIQGVGVVNGFTQQFIVGGDIQTDLGNYGVSSPWSDNGVGFLVGVEYREDTLERIPDQISQQPGGGFTGSGGATTPTSGQVEVIEFFSELQVPLITDREFFKELTFKGSYRYSSYDTAGIAFDGSSSESSFSTDAYGFQLAWAPVDAIKIRAQYQRAVRAPSVIELFSGVSTGLPNLSSAGTNADGVQLFDPCSSASPIATLEQCANTGVTPDQFGNIFDIASGQTQSITSGNPNLLPEVSDTFTAGVIFAPGNGLSVSVDYFNISVDEYINGGIPAQSALDGCLNSGQAFFCDFITRSASGSLAGAVGVGFDQANINVAELETSGIDFQVLHRYDLGNIGGVRLDYAATYLIDYDFFAFVGADPDECAGLFGNQCIQPVNPTYRHRLLTTWETPFNVDATLTWRYVGGTNNFDPSVGPDDVDGRLDTRNYIDLSANWTFNDNVRIRGGVLNLFNAQAPVFTAAGPPLGNGNTFPTVFDTGRFFFLGATFSY